MKLVSGIVDSGFFAQSALSAEVATKDSLGRNISETYLTAVDIPESANWNSTYNTVHDNSASWTGGGVTGDFTLVEGNGIQLTDDPIAQTTTISVSGDYATNTQLQNVSADITAMIPTALTGEYLDQASADTLYYPLNSNPNNYLTAAYTPEFAYHDTAISGIDNSALYDTSAQARINTLAGRISTLSSEKADTTALTAYQEITGMTAYQEAGDYYSASNPSGFITGVDLTPYQLTADMTAYQPAGDYLTIADSANFYTTANESGFITAVPDTYLQNTDLTITDGKVTEISGVPLSAGDELPSGVMNTSALEYNAVNEISGYNGSAIAQYGAEKQWLVHDDTLVHASNSAQYALGVNISAVAQLLGMDETVLWEGSATGITSVNLSEPLSGFKYGKIIFNPFTATVSQPNIIYEFIPDNSKPIIALSNYNTDAALSLFKSKFTFDNEKMYSVLNAYYNGSWTSADRITYMALLKVIGIGRKA